MKLTQFFSGDVQRDVHSVESPGRIQQTPAQMEHVNRQIRSLVPGQTISGEIVSRNGSEVQIKLADDMILNAKVDRELNIEVGKNMTFEVKNNGSTLTLNPLFTNVSTDVNVLKALDMAGLPVNQASVSMTEQLMAAGLSVNRNSLQQVYREINHFPQGTISDIINLHKLQMPVNETNVSQMASYRNLTHQLGEGMDTILGALPEVMDSMVEEGDIFGAVKLYQEVLSLMRQGAEDTVEGQTGANGEAAAGDAAADGSMVLKGNPPDIQGNIAADGNTAPEGNPAGIQENAAAGEAGGAIQAEQGDPAAEIMGNILKLKQMPEAGQEQDAVQKADPAMQEQNAVQEAGTAVQEQNAVRNPGPAVRAVLQGRTEPENIQGAIQEADSAKDVPKAAQELTAAPEAAGIGAEPFTEEIPDTLRRAVAEEALKLFDHIQLSPQDASGLRTQIMQFAQGQADIQQFFSSLQSLTDAGMTGLKSAHALAKFFSGHHFRELMTGQLKKLWTISPREVETPGKVEELYRRIDRQLKNLTQALENTGQTNTTAYKAASNMSQNVDFLQQVNQMYAYVQLPLRLQQSEAHGELYVYSNRKKLTGKDGKISALLHLDMDNLGSVDVYVAMQNNKVNTKFYLRDEEMIDFLAGHMELLTQRLKKRGYDCSVAMTTREGAEEATEGGLEPILGRKKGVMLSQYAFDVRT